MPSFMSKTLNRIPRSPSWQRRMRRALTLVEILIALSMTLIVLGAMMAAFGYASEEMQNGRALMELANRSRTVEDQFRSDIAAGTVEPRPYTSSTEPNGYFELIERPRRDDTEIDASTGAAPNINAYLGDVDDILGMTIRAQNGVMFRGRNRDVAGQPLAIESPLAEVIWFTSVKAAGLNSAITYDIPILPGSISIDSTVRVHRRQLLIRPDLGLLLDEQPPAVVNDFLAANDVSCRVVEGGGAGLFDVIANDLTDLARRENRFAHFISRPSIGQYGFPHEMTGDLLSERTPADGSDIMLTDVAAFDFRAYSPNAPVVVDTNANIVIEPGDLADGYRRGVAAAIAGEPGLSVQNLGAFVDLGRIDSLGLPPMSVSPSWFSGTASVKSQLGTGGPSVWDTWSPSYESDGIDQDGGQNSKGFSFNPVGGADQATNGVDDPLRRGGTSAPDDNAERETEPPYANPLRGIQLKIRLIEKGTQRVHQSSVIHSFVPE